MANIFSIDTLGSYDLMWKLAIVADIVLIQPINALYSKDILQISIARASFISILISFAAVFLVMIINFLNFNFLIFAWEVIFPQYELNQEILKISISFFIIMFAVNQLRNIMANRKLRLSLALSSAIIPLPLIAGFFFLQIDSLDLIPLLLIVGASLALIFNFITIINLRA